MNIPEFSIKNFDTDKDCARVIDMIKEWDPKLTAQEIEKLNKGLQNPKPGTQQIVLLQNGKIMAYGQLKENEIEYVVRSRDSGKEAACELFKELETRIGNSYDYANLKAKPMPQRTDTDA